MKKVEVHLYSQSEPILVECVRNTYTKGPLYCVLKTDGTVDKFPVEHVFRIREHPKSMTESQSDPLRGPAHQNDALRNGG